ncbi:hypothetical protein BU16DRAFT_614441 [Lophium mytilinum]|uniref:Uncharacterized protein n=1 Tax=Lophium mytilinum TaxID=390894 RepID=A0A6A6RAE4_9PEZI|nr:hypothetical protein BU16DRAFT_614441 [Lophium mytilinum]
MGNSSSARCEEHPPPYNAILAENSTRVEVQEQPRSTAIQATSSGNVTSMNLTISSSHPEPFIQIFRLTYCNINTTTEKYGNIVPTSCNLCIQQGSTGHITNANTCNINVHTYSASDIFNPVSCNIYIWNDANGTIDNPRSCNIYFQGSSKNFTISNPKGGALFFGENHFTNKRTCKFCCQPDE